MELVSKELILRSHQLKHFQIDELNESGLVKSFKILIGRKIGVGAAYLVKKPKPLALTLA